MPTTDPLEALLRRSPLPNSVRASLWDAYEATKDEDELASALERFSVPREVKAKLWDLKVAGNASQTAPMTLGRSVGASPGLDPGQAGPTPQALNVGIGPGAVPIGVDPRPGAAMAGLGAAGMAGMAAPAAAGAALRVAAPALRVAGSPPGMAAIAGASTLAGGGSVTDAVTNAALAGYGMKEGPKALRLGKKVLGGGGGAGKVAAVAKAAPKATVGATTKAAPSKGKEVAAKHNALMAFAKSIAAKHPKVGEKIWVLLDDAGTPVKWLTSTEAAAAARKGLKTSWAKNLWN